MLTFIFVPYRLKFWWILNARIDSFLASTADAFSTFMKRLSFTKSYLVLDTHIRFAILYTSM
jgi:hypothetical protein